MADKGLEAEGLRLHADHVLRVQSHMGTMIHILTDMLVAHDQSKYGEDEIDLIVGKPKLNATPYGTSEYSAALESVKAGVQSHYHHNRHHPEHHVNGICDMNLFDILEMLADWKAAGEQNQGTIEKSFEVNAERYSIPPTVLAILWNTVLALGWNRG